MGSKEILLELKNITKAFPGVIAVNDVSFDIRKGEIHIIIGENGAGKSTLVKMMAGINKIDSGEMIFKGKKYAPKNVQEAHQNGVNIIHQELSVMLNRTVAQNVYVGREPVKGGLRVIDTKKMNSDCQKLLDSLEIAIKPTDMIRDLSIAQQQMVEVAKAISTKNDLLIMDEPTSSLTQKEIDNLFRITRKLRDEGVSIIYISHRMQELMEIGDRVTIMRDGCYVGTREADELDMQELITMMVGRKIENVYTRTYNVPGAEVLRVENLAGLRFRNINLNIHSGEIVGLAGLVGAGRTELAKAIFGYDPIDSGKIFLNGKDIAGKGYHTSRAVEHKMSFLPEDRKSEGLCVSMSIEDNIVQSALPQLFRKGLVNAGAIREEAKRGIENLRIATTSEKKRVSTLSGGNQQKVVLAKWLVSESSLFIFDEPTRGIDVGAKSEIYALINDLVRQGAAVLMISSDLPELIGLADRIYVMKDGEISGEVCTNEIKFTQEHILSLAIVGGEAT
ncbi:sugar ABC transporter ATP-binding protein [Caproiciproducens sp.]